jgi:tyrosyl-tRNA synthetase
LATVRDVPEQAWPAGAGESLPLANLLKELQLTASTSDARRAVSQGGVSIDGKTVTDPVCSVSKSSLPLLIQLGKRRAARVVRGD